MQVGDSTCWETAVIFLGIKRDLVALYFKSAYIKH